MTFQREVVSEELDHVNEQYQQLSSAFAAQSDELVQAENDRKELRDRLAVRETELSKVKERKERRASVSKVWLPPSLPLSFSLSLSSLTYSLIHLFFKMQSFDDMMTMLQQSEEEKDRYPFTIFFLPDYTALYVHCMWDLLIV